ncbi:MAG: alpha/beta fold hydrolase, partial [Pseudonocardiaceae bacterium]
MTNSKTTVVKARDGTDIGVSVCGAGPPIVLVHGAASDARQWTLVAPLLAAAGFTVLAMDRRGRRASGPQRTDHSLETDYGDVATVAGAPGVPVHLVGHSSGARYAIHAAPDIPMLVSLTLYEPPAPEVLTDIVLSKLSAAESAQDHIGVLEAFFVDAVGIDEVSFAGLQARPIWPLMVDNSLTLPAELRAARSYHFEPATLSAVAVPTRVLLGDWSGPE